jgi:predicted metallo-beta-lactamase superfamily hydrolase
LTIDGQSFLILIDKREKKKQQHLGEMAKAHCVKLDSGKSLLDTKQTIFEAKRDNLTLGLILPSINFT